MDLSDKIAALAQRIAKQKAIIETEEATKNAFIMPFIRDLGYDIFDPEIVVPEFTADVGLKKGEKVDYAIKFDGKVSILIECKPCMSSLSVDHVSQLYRYFSVTDARFSILTNGIIYWFFTDLEQPNKMDARPFFEFDMLNYRPAQIDELKKFTSKNFDIASILETASDLKYSSLLMREISNEIENPSENIMRLLIARVYERRITETVLSRFGSLIQKAMKDTIREMVNQRLSSAIDGATMTALPAPEISREESANILQSSPENGCKAEGIVTTEDEIEGYQIVRAIVRETIKVSRVFMRDGKVYCAILLDDNNRKPICRLYFNHKPWYVGLFDSDKNEEKIPIEVIDDLFMYANRIKETAERYDVIKIKEKV